MARGIFDLRAGQVGRFATTVAPGRTWQQQPREQQRGLPFPSATPSSVLTSSLTVESGPAIT